jgi:hypothetical protein
VLLASATLTLWLVAGPVITKPLALLRFLTKLCPVYKLVTVRWTVTLVTPAGELAVKDKVEDGWNIFVPFG